MAKFKNKYRIESNRLKNWDYSSNGIYFITICTDNREHFFGEIEKIDDENALWHPTPLGTIAASIWYEIPKLYPFIELGEFVVMPNHIHGILIIDQSLSSSLTEMRLIASPLSSSPLSSSPLSQNEKKGGFAGDKNPMFHQSISRVVRWYKGRCSFEMRKCNPNFNWQSNYHDHIVRTEQAFINISNYIINNPINWKEDTFSKK